MGMFKTARLESAGADMRPVESGIVLRVLVTRGRRWPAASAWQFERDEADLYNVASSVVLRTLATRGRKRVPASAAKLGGWSGAEGPKDNTLAAI